jgi:5-methylcytosine-specific restriction endonuclease McrA
VSRKLATTPRSRVKNALRQLFLRSRERAACLRRDEYTCQICHKKQSKAKGKEFDVQVHHVTGIGNWEKVINIVFEELLCAPDGMQTLCPECHEKVSKEV